MSMLTTQVKRLRTAADQLDKVLHGRFDAIEPSTIPPMMREAADTIENLRNRLTETCELVNAGDGKCICFECGYKALDEWWNGFKYCPNCGRKVVE